MERISRMARNETAGGAAFTRLDLLAVTLMITLFGLVLSPAFARTRVNDQSFQCLNNLRQLMGAMLTYTHDYNDLFPPNPITNTTLVGHTWCSGNLFGLKNTSDRFNSDILKNPATSLLVPYIGAKVELFRCPADPARGVSTAPSNLGQIVPQARDYSMNEYVGTDPSRGGKVPVSPSARLLSYGSGAAIVRPTPAMLEVLLDENGKSINTANFEINFVQDLFQDCPGIYHNLGCNLVFADGHSETKMWEDPRIAFWPNGEPYSNPRNLDVFWLQARATALK
jgi:prepilin-type processing-associated H-X9-DG protein